MADTLKQVNVHRKFINEHQGYSQGDIDSDRYGKSYDAEIIYENVTKRIVYESSRERKIDFSGLKVDWAVRLNNFFLNFQKTYFNYFCKLHH